MQTFTLSPEVAS